MTDAVPTLFHRCLEAQRDLAIMSSSAHVRMLAHDVKNEFDHCPLEGNVGTSSVYRLGDDMRVAIGGFIRKGGFNEVRHGEYQDGDTRKKVVVRLELDTQPGRHIMFYTEYHAHTMLYNMFPSTFIQLDAPFKIMRHEQTLLGMVLTDHDCGDFVDWLYDGRIDDDMICSLVGQLMIKLQHAQTTSGFMHRDLKPDNIVIQMTQGRHSVTDNKAGAFPTMGVEPLLIDLSFARFHDEDGTWYSLDPYSFLKYAPKTCNPSADVTFFLYSLYVTYGKYLQQNAPRFYQMMKVWTRDFRHRVSKIDADDEDIRDSTIQGMSLRVPPDSLSPARVLKTLGLYWTNVDAEDQHYERDFDTEVMSHLKP